jgi:hypothetical protein
MYLNTWRIPGVFCRRKLLSRFRRTHRPRINASCLHVQAANETRCLPARTFMVLNIHRQLLIVEVNARAGDFQPRFKT